MITRPPAVSGTFYPGDPEQLRESVDSMLGTRDPRPMAGLIVPHAGHVYSGPVAASAYRLLAPRPVRVVLIGPSHFVPLSGLAVTSAHTWRTPLGEVSIDVDELHRLERAFDGSVLVSDAAHAREHCLEVQLPFLQRILPAGWTLVPLVVGHARADLVADVLAEALDDQTLLLVSTDLSHYLPYEVAAAKDRRTAVAIVAADATSIADDDACGAYALRGVLTHVRAKGLRIRELDLRSSGDTAGPRDRVVGYGSFTIEGADD